MKIDIMARTNESKQPNAALQRPGDNCARGKLSMRGTLIPIRCSAMLGRDHFVDKFRLCVVILCVTIAELPA